MISSSAINVNSEERLVHVKWNHFGRKRRFHLNAKQWCYSTLLATIRELEPTFNDSFTYTDVDGDKIHFSTDTEMQELLSILIFASPPDYTLRIESAEKRKTTVAESPKPIFHPNIVCDICDKNLCGTRYKCLVCDDFDLCEGCEKGSTHAQHAMIRLATPDTPKPYELIYGAGVNMMSRRLVRHQERLARRESREMARVQTNTERICGAAERQLIEQHRSSAKNIQKKRHGSESYLRRHPEMGDPTPRTRRTVGQSFNALKSFNAQLHTALINMGIEDETAVRHRVGEVTGRHAPPSSVAAGSPAEPASATGPENTRTEPIVNQLINAGLKQTVKRKSNEQNQNSAAAKTPKSAESAPAATFSPASLQSLAETAIAVAEVTSGIVRSVVNDIQHQQDKQQSQLQSKSPEPNQNAQSQTEAQTPSFLVEAANEAALQTAMFASLYGSRGEELVETANRVGLNIFNEVKNSVENIVTPLLSELRINGAIPLPPPPSQSTKTAQEVSPAAIANPTIPQPHVLNFFEGLLKKKPTPEESKDKISASAEKKGRLTELKEEKKGQQTSEAKQIVGQSYAGQVEASPVMDGEFSSIYIQTPVANVSMEDNTSNTSDNNDVEDVDIINLDEASPNEDALPTDQSTPSAAGSDGDSIASSYGVEPTNIAGTSASETDDDEWMVVKKASYKTLCDFYEQRRRENPSPGPAELSEVVPNAPLKEKILSSSNSMYSGLVNDMLTTLGARHVPKTNAQQPPLQQSLSSASIYPSILAPTAGKMPKTEEKRCYAGRPFYPIRRPHSKKCYVRHPIPHVQAAVDQLEAMGYDNCNGWLTGLSERFLGDISRILDAAAEDALYVARVAADS